MFLLHFTKPELADKLAKTYKPASRNNPPASTYTTSTLHIAAEPSTQLGPQLPAQPNPIPTIDQSNQYKLLKGWSQKLS